ncbi:rRNA maturation RNase YbeY [Anaeromicropila herbilytica]|uniref:Endoribonuclease YbeY n=1 Tax=Anaeromicropila herbilytica TaxID=2785025 RepID=A0A7R7EKQ8_9FIRM|nr:rRNA maturation RNase YbeY [Anaeromicropila herbilytica]BCN30582.1 endoribonuclease YbeY [Anaeromicropila herbilytica]
MTINFEYETDIKLAFDYEDIMTKVVNEAIDYEDCPYEIELNVILTDNEMIREINQAHRDIDKPTDVLSFPMIDYNEPSNFDVVEDAVEEFFNLDSGELMLGDIIISVEKVIEQAENYGHSELRELAFLTAHSMLHLFGYDHMVDEERVVMEKKQEEILKNLSILR